MSPPEGAGEGEPDPDGPPLWGEPIARGGRGCQSLREVRAEIDRIDSALIALIAERLSFTREAGRFKASEGEVAAPARAKAVVARAVAEAERQGVPAEIAEAVFGSLVTASIEDQRRLYRAVQEGRLAN